jgi:hypothetical protein
MPLQSYKDHNGIRQFSNDLVGKEIYVDHIALEDFVKFQGAEYEIICGYYFNEGLNDKISDVIQYIFKLRKTLKEQKNKPGEQLVKLMMNSSYGKTCLKFSDKSLKIIGVDEFDSFVKQNIEKFDSAIKHISGRYYIVKTKNYQFSHENKVHCGSLILSMSKRIMNEVMCLAEDNDL